MTRAESIFEKIAKKSKKKTYPVSRGITSFMNAYSLGIDRTIHQRAAMGRAAQGKQGITPNEGIMLNALSKKHNTGGKTYPISRLGTNPLFHGSLFAGGTALARKVIGLKSSPKAVLKSGLKAGAIMTGVRAVKSRANIGRSRKERKGILPSDKKVLRALKKAKV